MENFETIPRRTTDGCCRYFFLIVCIVWVVCWLGVVLSKIEYNGLPENKTVHDVLHLRHLIDYNDSIMEWNNSDCTPYSVYSKLIADKNKSVNDTANRGKSDKEAGYILLIHLLFHTLTFDPTYMADCSDPMYPLIFIFGGVTSIYFLLISIFLIIIDKKMLRKQPSVIVCVFLFIIIVEHFSELLISFVSPALWLYDKRLVYWLIPELLIFLILLPKIIFAAACKIQNDSSDVGLNCFGTKKKDSTYYQIIPFHCYTYAVMFSFCFAVIFKFLVISMIIALNKIGWANRYFILILICCYIMYKTIYNIGLMSTSYATHIYISNDEKNFSLKYFWRALYIIIRYHCGTALHYGLPWPASSMASDGAKVEINKHGIYKGSSSKKYAKLKKKFRKYFRLSRVLTATKGNDYSETIPIVSRLILTEPVHKYFSSFGKRKQIFYGLLMPINFLTHALLWHYGLFDADIAEATWFKYLIMTLTFNLVMQFFKAASDTIGLHMLRHELLSDRPVEMDEIAFTEEL